MRKKTRIILITVYIGLGLIGIHILGEVYATEMMDELVKNPTPDLYANNHGFQYVSFLFTRGIALVFVLLLSAILLNKVLGNGVAKNS